MKLLTVTVPCYNSEAYMRKAIDSILTGGDQVEILVVDDGSTDGTAAIADEYERAHPGIVRAIHKENGGHGDAVMTGLHNATGRYFKVVDSDDWLDEQGFALVLSKLSSCEEIDMCISNYIYDKVGVKHKHVMHYRHNLPKNKVFGWQDAHFYLGKYLLMHSVIYRTQLLRDCGMELPKHTFYVDDLYVYLPLPKVEKMIYLDVDLYHYYIGREDQSVQEEVMIRRIDQALLVNRLLVTGVELAAIENRHKRTYMRNFVEIITIVSNVLLYKSGTEENLRKRVELWHFIRTAQPALYRQLRYRLAGILLHIPGKLGRFIAVNGYNICRRVVGFN